MHRKGARQREHKTEAEHLTSSLPLSPGIRHYLNFGILSDSSSLRPSFRIRSILTRKGSTTSSLPISSVTVSQQAAESACSPKQRPTATRSCGKEGGARRKGRTICRTWMA